MTVKISKAREALVHYYLSKMPSRIDVKKSTINEIENEGIVFIDEIDKIAMPSDRASSGRNPSSEGVQRDLLPLIEGTVINTKYGDINTTNILFICAGAFSFVKPTDMMPELLGRLPNRIQLTSLNRKDFRKILTEVDNNLLLQYQKLLETEGISISFTDDAIEAICRSTLFLTISI